MRLKFLIVLLMLGLIGAACSPSSSDDSSNDSSSSTSSTSVTEGDVFIQDASVTDVLVKMQQYVDDLEIDDPSTLIMTDTQSAVAVVTDPTLAALTIPDAAQGDTFTLNSTSISQADYDIEAMFFTHESESTDPASIEPAPFSAQIILLGTDVFYVESVDSLEPVEKLYWQKIITADIPDDDYISLDVSQTADALVDAVLPAEEVLVKTLDELFIVLEQYGSTFNATSTTNGSTVTFLFELVMDDPEAEPITFSVMFVEDLLSSLVLDEQTVESDGMAITLTASTSYVWNEILEINAPENILDQE